MTRPHRRPATWATALVAGAILLAGVARARAEVARGDLTRREWFAGVNLRTDYGTHHDRVEGGVRVGRLAMTLVIDPKILYQHLQNDADALVEWMISPGGWAVLGGWRVDQISIDRGVQYHHQLLLGVTGGLPALAGGHIRGRFGAELEATIVRHGAGLETDWLSLDSQRAYRDLFSANLFLRLEYAAGF